MTPILVAILFVSMFGVIAGGLYRTEVPYLIPLVHWFKIRAVPQEYQARLLKDKYIQPVLTDDGQMMESHKELTADALNAIRRYKSADKRPAKPLVGEVIPSSYKPIEHYLQ